MMMMMMMMDDDDDDDDVLTLLSANFPESSPVAKQATKKAPRWKETKKEKAIGVHVV